jgi:hypothetical protein
LGIVQGNPLDPENPLAVALTGLMGTRHNDGISNAPPTEEHDMAREMSNAAAERAAAQKALKNGDLKERETYTAKQVAMRCGTDAKTMRKFFRSSHSTVEAVGQGGRYEFEAKDMPKIKAEFTAWLNRSSVKRPKAASEIPSEEAISKVARMSGVDPEALKREVEAEMTAEPTEEELAEIEELDLDDMEEE